MPEKVNKFTCPNGIILELFGHFYFWDHILLVTDDYLGLSTRRRS
jgi:hypothetical protein